MQALEDWKTLAVGTLLSRFCGSGWFTDLAEEFRLHDGLFIKYIKWYSAKFVFPVKFCNCLFAPPGSKTFQSEVWLAQKQFAATKAALEVH